MTSREVVEELISSDSKLPVVFEYQRSGIQGPAS